MPPRLLPLANLRTLRPSTLLPLPSRTLPILSRQFHPTPPTLETATPVPIAPVKKPVGAFRSGMFGFLLGSTLAGVGTWFYIMEEYRVSNELLTEDIYALQAAVQRIHSLVVSMEERLVLSEMKNSKK